MSSLQHILAPEPASPVRTSTNAHPGSTTLPLAPMPAAKEAQLRATSNATQTALPSGDATTPLKKTRDATPNVISTTKRNTAGNSSSVFSGNKVQHLKPDDGVPLWRKDIQYDFLRIIFDDMKPCFTRFSDKTTGHTFATVYVDAMACSSKTSKILKEKLLQDDEGAIIMAMVCLLVNVGRMNTTLNFFPEMRAQLRTYHSIPALQAHRDPNAYKQLQDAPRLKSILKAAAEDEPQPTTMEELRKTPYPRTTPVNLIFLLSQSAHKSNEGHFTPPRDFFDLFTRTTLSSASRARAFLWLMWWYMESDFTAHASRNNPFGPGELGEGEQGTDVIPTHVPALEHLTEEQAEKENVDPPDERRFGETKRKERLAILAEPSPAATAPKRAKKDKTSLIGMHGMPGSDDEGSDAGWLKGATPSGIKTQPMDTASDYTRSPSPAQHRGHQTVSTNTVGDMRINNLLNNDDLGPDQSPPRSAPTPSSASAKKGPGRGNWRRKKPDGTQTAGRTSLEGGYHVPLLPNTGQISFVSDGPAHSQGSPSAAGNPGSSGAANATSANSRGDHVPTPSYQAQKRHRGITQHQSAVINHRKQQIEYQLDRRIRKIHARAAAVRERRPVLLRAWIRIRELPVEYDSEGEVFHAKKDKVKDASTKDHHRGGPDDPSGTGTSSTTQPMLPPGPTSQLDTDSPPRIVYAGFGAEAGDVGEEVRALARAFRRATRRFERWDNSDPGVPIIRRNEAEAAHEQEMAARAAAAAAAAAATEAQDEEEGDEEDKTTRTAKRRKRNEGRKRARPNSKSAAASASASAPDAKGRKGIAGDGGSADIDGTDGGHGGGGIADLDEDDKELLGMVDAEESEADDEDEEMEDVN